MKFTNIDQGLLLFYIAVGVLGVLFMLLYIAGKMDEKGSKKGK